MFNKLYSSLTFPSQALWMINGDTEIQCHQHKIMIYDDKENTFISIKNMKLFEELKLTREGADPEFAAVSVLPLLHAYTPPFCPVHVTV